MRHCCCRNFSAANGTTLASCSHVNSHQLLQKAKELAEVLSSIFVSVAKSIIMAIPDFACEHRDCSYALLTRNPQ